MLTLLHKNKCLGYVSITGCFLYFIRWPNSCLRRVQHLVSCMAVQVRFGVYVPVSALGLSWCLIEVIHETAHTAQKRWHRLFCVYSVDVYALGWLRDIYPGGSVFVYVAASGRVAHSWGSFSSKRTTIWFTRVLGHIWQVRVVFLNESSEVWLGCDGRAGLIESDRWNFHSGLDYTWGGLFVKLLWSGLMVACMGQSLLTTASLVRVGQRMVTCVCWPLNILCLC